MKKLNNTTPGTIYTADGGHNQYLCLQGNTDHYPTTKLVSLKTGFVFDTNSPDVYENNNIYFHDHVGGHHYGEDPKDEIYGAKYFKCGKPWERKDETVL